MEQDLLHQCCFDSFVFLLSAASTALIYCLYAASTALSYCLSPASRCLIAMTSGFGRVGGSILPHYTRPGCSFTFTSTPWLLARDCLTRASHNGIGHAGGPQLPNCPDCCLDPVILLPRCGLTAAFFLPFPCPSTTGLLPRYFRPTLDSLMM